MGNILHDAHSPPADQSRLLVNKTTAVNAATDVSAKI